MDTTPSERDGDDWQVMQPPAPRPSRAGRAVRAAGIVAGGAVVAGAMVGGANAWASSGTSTPSAAGGYGTAAPGYGTPGGGPAGAPGSGQGSGHGGGPGGGSADTPVTGDEAAKVTAAVTAKDGSVTVTSVRKDPDGSYDALGTKAGAPVMFDVSADLKTITQNTGGPGQHGAGRPDGAGQQAPGGNAAPSGAA